MPEYFRSLIFVPGNNPRFLDKARGLEADIVCLDLEDSVPLPQKARARDMVFEALERGGYAASVFVRTNSPASGMIPQDLEVVVPGGPDGIVVPKVDGSGDMVPIFDTLARLEPEGAGTAVIPSIESAAGVVNAYHIASCGPRVCALVFGVFDLLNDMGIEYSPDTAASYARAKVPVDAAAAGIPAIDGIWQDVRDAGGLASDCRTGRNMGYSGKSLIHPGQICDTHRMFAPTESDIKWAEKVCHTYQDMAAESGRGATVVDGKMIDEVHYKRAKSVLRLAADHK